MAHTHAALVVAVDHPSLQHLVPPFVETLRRERRHFGRAGRANPKPFPSLVRRITDPQRRRFGVMLHGNLIGMASLADDGDVAIAIDASHRNMGHGGRLLEHVVRTAARDGYHHLTMASSQRSRPIACLGGRSGWTTQLTAPGRLEMFLPLDGRLTG